MSRSEILKSVLICSISPYFLERENSWFGKNLEKILEARKIHSFWQDNTLFLEKDQEFLVSSLLRKLDEMGYEKVWQVSEIGEFSQRGGILDIFPIGSNFPIRIEFFGNKIENIFRLPIEIKDENLAKEILKKKLKSQKLFSDLKGLKPGDYVVHLDHGIGKFINIVSLKQNSSKFHDREFSMNYYLIEYGQGDRLYVPFGLERKLSRYIGFVEPKISRLGSLTWQRTKRKVKEEAEKLARELLEIYAKREITTRPPYLPADEIDFQLVSNFQYQETLDQIQVLEEIKKDLEKTEPMDRLICGDVGFGKTEVALRTMVRAVNSGYQAAMICPTTILVNQHYQNFKNRLKNLPIKVAMLSRLQSKKEQKKIIEGLKKGEIDIVIGTHRLLSRDIENWLSQQTPDRVSGGTKGLGLLVIDDEHKFGVRQKEKLKKMRTNLDVLSLSATPIPRTLYLALSSLRNISLIQTPPPGRIAVETFILPFSKKIVKKAIKDEIKRDGQVYYLHNRVETIETAKKFLECLNWQIKKGVKFGIAHGRLKEKELVKVMTDFQNKKIDVLVATTIIENGLDLPNVNTLIVADATKLGLAELYQLRGRVGRSYKKAVAYFFYPKKVLTKMAKERLMALKEAEALGSGYKIAMADLEMRGAGNILGKEQSGNINAVGLNIYCQLVSQAIDKMKISPK